METHEGIEIGIRVSGTVRAERERPARVLAREVARGLDAVTNPLREDEGILGYSVETADDGVLTMRVRVMPGTGNSLEDTTYATLTAIRRGLDRVTNYLRSDDGLLSFALDDAPELTDAFPRAGF